MISADKYAFKFLYNLTSSGFMGTLSKGHFELPPFSLKRRKFTHCQIILDVKSPFGWNSCWSLLISEFIHFSYMYAFTHWAQKMCPQPVWWGFRTIPPQDGQTNCCSNLNTKRRVRLVRTDSSSHDLMGSEFCRENPGSLFSSVAMETW